MVSLWPTQYNSHCSHWPHSSHKSKGREDHREKWSRAEYRASTDEWWKDLGEQDSECYFESSKGKRSLLWKCSKTFFSVEYYLLTNMAWRLVKLVIRCEHGSSSFILNEQICKSIYSDTLSLPPGEWKRYMDITRSRRVRKPMAVEADHLKEFFSWFGSCSKRVKATSAFWSLDSKENSKDDKLTLEHSRTAIKTMSTMREYLKRLSDPDILKLTSVPEWSKHIAVFSCRRADRTGRFRELPPFFKKKEGCARS